MKDFYKKKAKEHFEKYQIAADKGDLKAMAFHQKEYLTYDKASK